MAELTHKQVNLINDLIIDYGVHYDELKLDILDHICCMIEEKMDSGYDFGESFTLSTKTFGLHQLQHIQETTLYLLTLKLRKMKKLTGILGIISSLLILAGVLFKINHLPGAGILLVIGLVIVSIIVLPLFAYLEMIKENTQMQKITSFTGIISGALVSVGTLCKIMHWPGASVFLVTGLILIVGVFIPLFTIKNYKTTEFKLIAIAKSLLIVSGIAIIWGLVPINSNDSATEQPNEQLEHIEVVID